MIGDILTNLIEFLTRVISRLERQRQRGRDIRRTTIVCNTSGNIGVTDPESTTTYSFMCNLITVFRTYLLTYNNIRCLILIT